MSKVNLFIDMDGVLAEQQNDLVNFMYDKDFFLNRPPVHKMLDVTKRLTEENYDVFILTSVVGNEYCEPEKGLWLDKYLPEVKKENRLYVPSGKVKSEFVNENVNVDDALNVLIDDFTVNLDTWEFEGALPIKALNGLNNNNGTWVNNGGLHINVHDNPDYTVEKVNDLIYIHQLRRLRKKLDSH